MSIKSSAEFEALRHIGQIVRGTLDKMAASVRPGVSTAELDEIASKSLADHGAESSPPKVYGFPGTACISVNEEAIHGIPSGRVLKPGDLVKLDLTAEKNGFVTDAAVTVGVGEISAMASSLAHCAERAFYAGAECARAGNRVYDIGRAVEREVRRSGFAVMKQLCGHGVGRTIHEEPCVPNHFDNRHKSILTEGLVLTIEPIISVGSGRERLLKDGWTISTADQSFAAHFEHTIVITRGMPILLTAAA
jgi:methionyl aminopeptidase